MKTSKDVGTNMLLVTSCYGLRNAWKFLPAPKQLQLDQLAVSKQDARLLWRFLTSCDLDL